MKKTNLFLILVMISSLVFAQKKEYQVSCIGFYNLENLFDTIDSPENRDSEFTPKSDKHWNTEKYFQKLNNMSEVIAQLGTETTPDGAAILGVCEVENRLVLEDLVKTEKLKDRDYQIVHFQSPDYRGIDVGLLYQPKYFTVESTKTYELNFEDNPKYKTREQLLVSGLLNGEKIHIIVNHWPSRYGGEKASRPKRNKAAQLARSIVDSLQQNDPEAKVIVMGDLNDDPTNQSVKKYLNAKANKENLKNGELYNPWYKMYKQGIGTLAYRDSWNLFDQIIISEPLTREAGKEYTFYQAKVHKNKKMLQQEGRFKGYPLRTFVGNTFMGGYSDHFPTYILLIREKK